MAKPKPLDLIIDILSRLPLKSLARFRCASKRCYAYVDDDLLAVLHGERFVEEPTPIMYDPHLSCIVRFDIEKGATITLTAKKGMSLESKSHPYQQAVGSCNGLLYISQLNHIPHITSLDVIHPIRKEYHELKPLQRWSDGRNLLFELFRGLGFDVSSSTYKMVCVLSRVEYSESGAFDSTSTNLCTMVHVLGMDDSSWREIPQVPPYITSSDGISANGCLYWLVSNKDSRRQSRSRKEFICFDLCNEEFTSMNPPKKRSGYSVTCQLVDLLGELGYAYHYSDNITELWVLKQNQWAKHCQFNTEPLHYPRSWHSKVLGRWNKDGDILIQIGEKKLFVYSLKDNLLNEVKIVGGHDKYGFINGYIYMCPASSLSLLRGIKKTTIKPILI